MSLSWPVSWKRSFLRSRNVLDCRSRSYRPQLESLEDRLAPSTDFVTTTSDSGTGSLRAVLASANTGDTIEFQLTKPSTIALTSGTLTIDKNLTISGLGMTSLTINGAGQSQSIFKVQPGVAVSISALRLEGGKAAQGGGIFDSGQLTLKTVGLTSNGSTGSTAQGGGIYVAKDASLLIVSSTFKNNQAKASAGAAKGGAIYATNAAKVTLSKDHFSSNRAAGGLGNGSTGGTAQGGGVYWSGTGSLTANQSVFKNNQAQGGTGGFGSVIQRFAGGIAAGGGLYAQGTVAAGSKWSGDTFRNNQARGGTGGGAPAGGPSSSRASGDGGNGLGGGIYWSAGQAVFSALTVSTNTAQGGQGGPASTTTSLKVKVAGGRGGDGQGGGIFWASGTGTLSGSSLRNNTASGGSGGGKGAAAGAAQGGAIAVTGAAKLTLSKDQVTSNALTGAGITKAQGGGLYVTKMASLRDSGSSFKNNHARASNALVQGGAIYATGAAKVTLSNAHVTANAAAATGGNENAQGGGLYLSQSSLKVIGTTFQSNGAFAAGSGTGAGGAIFATKMVQGTLSKTDQFISNAAKGGSSGGAAEGGGLYWNGSGSLTLNDTTFKADKAAGAKGALPSGAGKSGGRGGDAQGGGLFIQASNTLSPSLEHDTFQSNIALGGSGATGAKANTQISVSQGGGIGGTGGSGGAAQGGGLYWGTGAGMLSASRFTGNQAVGGRGGNGGNGGRSNALNPGGTIFIGRGGAGEGGGNGQGGAIYWAGGAGGLASLTISHNEARGGTGGNGGKGAGRTVGLESGNPIGVGGPAGGGGAGQGGGLYWAGGDATVTTGAWSQNRATGGSGGQGGTGGSGVTATSLHDNPVTGGNGNYGAGGGTGGAGQGAGLYWAGAMLTDTKTSFSQDTAAGGQGGQGGTGGAGGQGNKASHLGDNGGKGGAPGAAADGGSGGAGEGGAILVAAGSASLIQITAQNESAFGGTGGTGGTGGEGGNGGEGSGLRGDGGDATAGNAGGTGGEGGLGAGGAIAGTGGNATVTDSTFSSTSVTGGNGGTGGTGGRGGNGGFGDVHDGTGGNGGDSGNGGNAAGPNSANAEGGAIYWSAGRLALSNSSILQGSASGGAGGNHGSQVGKGGTGHDSGGHSGSLGSSGSGAWAGGGGLYVNGGSTTLLGLTFAKNQAVSSSLSYGGAIYASAYLAMTNSTVSANSADHGGGLDINNQSNTQGGYALLLTNVTIAGNTASALAGGLDFESSPVNLTNTIVANNTGPSGSNGPDLFGYVALSLADDILVSTSSGSGYTIDKSENNNQLGIDPQLGPLRDNGGPTHTMALLSTSPAINAGDNNAVPSGVINDQRGPGYVRIFDDIVDIGAYEYQPFSTTVALASGQANPTSQSPIQFTVTFGAAVTGFSSKDVTLSGTAGPTTATVTVSGASYTVAVSGMSQSGSVIVSVAGGVVTDGLLNPNAPSNAATVTYTVSSLLGLSTEYAASVPVGGAPMVPVINAVTGASLFTLTPFDPSFTGGVNVAVGCGLIVTGAGGGGGPMVKVYDSNGNLLFNVFAFDPAFTGGVSVAVGYLHGDAVPYVIVGAGVGGGPAVNVYNGQTGALVDSFFAFDPSFTGGVTVAAGDVTGNGAGDVIVGAGLGGGPVVAVFSGQNPSMMLHEFFAFDPSFTGGVTVAAEDVNLNGHADIIVGAGPGGGSFVSAFDGATGAVLDSFFAYTGSLGGVRVAQGGFNSAGQALIRTGQGPATSTNGAQNFNALLLTNLDSYFAFDPHAGKFTPFTPQ